MAAKEKAKAKVKAKARARANVKPKKKKIIPLIYKGRCCKKLCKRSEVLNCYANHKDAYCADLIYEKRNK
jgi:hypothetical protein